MFDLKNNSLYEWCLPIERTQIFKVIRERVWWKPHTWFRRVKYYTVSWDEMIYIDKDHKIVD